LRLPSSTAVIAVRVELRERRTEIEDAAEGEIRAAAPKLLIDKVCDPSLTRLRDQCLAQRLKVSP